MNEAKLKQRTEAFGLHVRKLTDAPAERPAARIRSGQLGRPGPSVGPSCRSRSVGEMMSRLAAVGGAADESVVRLELIGEQGRMTAARLASLQQETGEPAAVLGASRRTSSRRRKTANVRTGQSKMETRKPEIR